ncbi:MAG: acyl carrier protein, partial [Lachnospiraceae bacterium]|nr:acyl carrier protein [Lachnospiraceae bacterium]
MDEMEKLKQIIARVLNVDPNEITPDSTFIEDLGADSLDVFQIVTELEEEFQITIPQEKVEKIKTAG